MNTEKVWLTQWPGCESLATLSIESARIEPAHYRVSVRESLFPESPTAAHPRRHVINLGLLERDDLIAIRDAINKYL
jgi:hypothetical protein